MWEYGEEVRNIQTDTNTDVRGRYTFRIRYAFREM